MSVEEIASQVTQFSSEEFTRFSLWFNEHRTRRLINRCTEKSIAVMPGAQEVARRRQLLQEIDELRADVFWNSGIQPDSTEIIRSMRDLP